MTISTPTFEKPHTNRSHLIPASDRARVLPLPNRTCSGLIQQWQLRPGLDLVIHDVAFRDKTIVERDHSSDGIHLGVSFCLLGRTRRIDSPSELGFQLESGQASLGVLNGCHSRVEYREKQRVLLVHVHVRPDIIRLADRETVEQLPEALGDAMLGRDRPFYFQSCAMTPVMAATVKQLLHCPYQGLSQRLYMESKALELIGLYFDRLLPDLPLQQAASPANRDEVDRIVLARDILLSRIEDPPTLLELASQVSLNDRKLKQGFRQVFGTTVFNYLRDHRLQQARQLLLMPQATIAGVAQKVGYRSPEAFSVAFRRAFAIAPKAYQMQQR